jgi:hypothetical protein
MENHTSAKKEYILNLDILMTQPTTTSINQLSLKIEKHLDSSPRRPHQPLTWLDLRCP